jgi:phosphoribosylformimino-5-aminoimidazole carboxamide ribotide isomerase
MDGLVVRGVAGRRSEYRPIISQIATDATPANVARAFAEKFGFDTAYVADLDAIQFGRPNVAAWQAIAGAGLKLWLDAGIGTSAIAGEVLNRLADAQIDAQLVVGSESLASTDELRGIVEHCLHRPPIFSLDLLAGRPLVRNPAWQGLSPLELALAAVAWGCGELIVLDLADVGTHSGTRTLELCRQIRRVCPPIHLIAGGGVRGAADLRPLAEAGCQTALVASALHDGRLTPAEIAAELQRL